MSNAAEVEADVVCAWCGIAEVDNIKLEDCDGCDLVKYCGDKCKGDHREQHEEDCKMRGAILHDKKLFSKPDGSHLGECPLCFLPMPLDPQKWAFNSCCCKYFCDGCDYADCKSNGSYIKCPFCREPVPAGDNEHDKRLMKRVKAKDPAAMCFMGSIHYEEGDVDGAVKYCTMAAELGDVIAHNQLGHMFRKGEGVKKDEEKSVYHFEKAAIGGHPDARHNLAAIEEKNGNIERAVKHSIIAANLGHESSMKELWGVYKDGYITKEELDATLRTHHAAINEMKSPEREAAEVWRENQGAW